MAGSLAYGFEAIEGGTRVIPEQVLRPRRVLRLFRPAFGRMFSAMDGHRLEGIRSLWLRELPDR